MQREKPITWLGTSRQDAREFPTDARRDIGHALYLVQLGEPPPHYRNMTSIGTGVREIIAHSGQEGLDHRVLYIATFEDAIYVLHAFEKRSEQTTRADAEKGKRRLRELYALKRAEAKEQRRKR